jgi:hypothetical protein
VIYQGIFAFYCLTSLAFGLEAIALNALYYGFDMLLLPKVALLPSK